MRERVCKIDAAHPIINSVQLPNEGVNRTGCQSAGALTQFPITCLRVNNCSACPISTKRKFNNILGWTWRYGLQGGKGGEETNQLSLHGGLLSLIGFPLDKDPTPQSGYQRLSCLGQAGRLKEQGFLLKRHILDKNWHSGHLGIGTQHTVGLPSRGTKRTERKPKSQQMQRNAQRSHCNGLGNHFKVAPGGKSKTEVSLFSLAKSDQCSRLAAAPTRTVGPNIRHNYCEGGW